MTIKELRLLPPLAFARLGSASEPQANYTLEDNEDNPLGFRRIVPMDTLVVAEDGTLTIRRAPAGSELKLADLNAIFRHRAHIRPVAPFFELFAITDEDKDKLVPVTIQLLEKHRLDPSAIEWSVHVENRKVLRRTGDEKDKVKADTGWFSHHGRNPLSGTCDHFVDQKTIDFGFVQFVKPNTGDAVSSQIRLRFTPGPGKIYGPVGGTRRDEELHIIPIYKGGIWPDFDENYPKRAPMRPRETLPPSLYAIEPPAPPWLNHDRAVSLGYLDDACDGFIEVQIKGHASLHAKARICSGPPSFVPDAQFIRTLEDDLDQVVNGPGPDGLDVEEAHRRTLEYVRRGYEAVRAMNVAVMNGNEVRGRDPAEFDTMPAEESFATGRRIRPVMSPGSVDTAAILQLHQQVFAALSTGTAPWFLQLLRKPDEVGDLTDRGRRKMPALMSGADSLYLALTHRQIATVALASAERSDSGWVPVAQARNLSAQDLAARQELTAQLRHRAAGNPINSRPEMAIANCCPGLEVDFRAVWRRLFDGIELGEHDNYVVAGTAVDVEGKSLVGRRLLSVAGKDVTVILQGPSTADPAGKVTLGSHRIPHGVWTKEWSNCFADVIDGLRRLGISEVECLFTSEPAKIPPSSHENFVRAKLKLRDFFEKDTAFISEALAEPGELTQGLCSPWQNDLRECSCFYWASSRPDFVNTTIGDDGLTHGDYWLAKVRTGEYVPDDYADSRLIGYEDLFKNWEQLQIQIGGKDSAPDLPQPPATPRPRKL
jgi:hypothetical protein